jgi:hypothetical protein
MLKFGMDVMDRGMTIGGFESAFFVVSDGKKVN